MEKFKAFLKQTGRNIHTFFKELFSDSTITSMAGIFIVGYYLYLGVFFTITSGSGVIFAMLAMPALVAALFMLGEALIAPTYSYVPVTCDVS